MQSVDTIDLSQCERLTCDEDGTLVGLEVVDVFGHIVLEVADGSLADQVVQHVVIQSLQGLERVLEDLTKLPPLRLIVLPKRGDHLFSLKEQKK